MNLEEKKPQFQKVLERAQQELASIRTNRATPALIENIKVNVYGLPMSLIQVASITCPEPRQLLVEPWDKNILKDAERAIQTASLGLSVSNEGNFLRLIMSAMTQETRQEVIKLLNEKLEKARVVLRGVRDSIKEEIISAERHKEMGEDEKYKLIEELDKMTREFVSELEEMGRKKEGEISL